MNDRFRIVIIEIRAGTQVEDVAESLALLVGGDGADWARRLRRLPCELSRESTLDAAEKVLFLVEGFGVSGQIEELVLEAPAPAAIDEHSHQPRVLDLSKALLSGSASPRATAKTSEPPTPSRPQQAEQPAAAPLSEPPSPALPQETLAPPAVSAPAVVSAAPSPQPPAPVSAFMATAPAPTPAAAPTPAPLPPSAPAPAAAAPNTDAPLSAAGRPPGSVPYIYRQRRLPAGHTFFSRLSASLPSLVANLKRFFVPIAAGSVLLLSFYGFCSSPSVEEVKESEPKSEHAATLQAVQSMAEDNRRLNDQRQAQAAQAMFFAEHGRPPRDVQELVEMGYLPPALAAEVPTLPPMDLGGGQGSSGGGMQFVHKTCGSCGKPVSSSAQVGDTCEHCGVRWGYENVTTLP
ncbi:MAG: hypothetical protein RBU37_16835 [Myxococcota bacterium]|jgi:hypothetical protein|nr:hypothetical protein [Myxococcota bacterium]